MLQFVCIVYNQICSTGCTHNRPRGGRRWRPLLRPASCPDAAWIHHRGTELQRPPPCLRPAPAADLGEDGDGGCASACSGRPLMRPPFGSASSPSCSRRRCRNHRRRRPPLARVRWESKGSLNGRTESAQGRGMSYRSGVIFSSRNRFLQFG